MRTIKRNIVAAMIVSNDGKIFQCMKRPNQGGVYPDLWHMPGGGVEEGETQKQALIREIKEETGINISTCKLVLIDDAGRGVSEKTLEDTGEKVLCEMEFAVYRVAIEEPAEKIEVALGNELGKYVWTPASELKNKKLTPPSEELFRRLGYLK